MTKKIIFLVIILIAAGALYYIYFDSEAMKETRVTDRGNADIIKVFSPTNNQKISSPLEIKGEARGNWFFEATFPVVLTDWDGRIIAQHYAEAQKEWMTEAYVPFEAVLNFEKPAYGERGFLILKKDNPSGLPEHDDAVEIPILFK